MQTTPSIIPQKTIKLPRATLAAQQYNFSHRWLFKVLPDLNEEQWAAMIIDYGLQYCDRFSKIFGANEKKIFQFLTTTQPLATNTHNLFWNWFKLKWMMDDHEFITQKVYRQPISYNQYKLYLFNSDILEQELLNILSDNLIF